MQRQIHPLLKACSFLPSLILMGVIFSFSAQTGEQSSGLSYRASSFLVTAGETLSGHSLTPLERQEWVEKIHTPVRKAAHMSEYCLLALSLSLPLSLWGIRGRSRFFLTLVFCAAFAGSDEFHQSFVGGRSPSLRDVGIDSLGAAIGCFAVVLGSLFKSRRYSASDSRTQESGK